VEDAGARRPLHVTVPLVGRHVVGAGDVDAHECSR
jgi:hypothetical protein